jgi:hypothetical protein
MIATSNTNTIAVVEPTTRRTRRQSESPPSQCQAVDSGGNCELERFEPGAPEKYADRPTRIPSDFPISYMVATLGRCSAEAALASRVNAVSGLGRKPAPSAGFSEQWCDQAWDPGRGRLLRSLPRQARNESCRGQLASLRWGLVLGHPFNRRLQGALIMKLSA